MDVPQNSPFQNVDTGSQAHWSLVSEQTSPIGVKHWIDLSHDAPYPLWGT